MDAIFFSAMVVGRGDHLHFCINVTAWPTWQAQMDRPFITYALESTRVTEAYKTQVVGRQQLFQTCHWSGPRRGSALMEIVVLRARPPTAGDCAPCHRRLAFVSGMKIHRGS